MQRPAIFWALLLFFFLWLSILPARGDSNCILDDSSQFKTIYLAIQKGTKYSKYALRSSFNSPINYVITKKGLRRIKLFYAEAKEAPINIYYEKRSNLIFLIEINGVDARNRVAIRSFLLKHGVDIGELEFYFGKYLTIFEAKYGQGVAEKHLNKKYLYYKTNFGVICLPISRDAKNHEWVVGAKIWFNIETPLGYPHRDFEQSGKKR